MNIGWLTLGFGTMILSFFVTMMIVEMGMRFGGFGKGGDRLVFCFIGFLWIMTSALIVGAYIL